MLRAALGLTAALTACAVLSNAALGAAPKIPKYIAAAVADPSRPEADKKRDADRKPAETLAFAGIKPGQSVAELLPNGGYYTRLLSKVVGPKGHVYALQPPKRPNAPATAPDFAAQLKELASQPGFSNLSVETFAPGGEGLVPMPVDVVWTTNNYHDLHNIPNMDIAAFNKRVFDALKPGGTYFIGDHATAPGAGTSATRTLHRIDPETVKSEVTAAGFKLAGQSDVLHNPDDPHTAPVFDPSIRGKTDQFLLKFTKP